MVTETPALEVRLLGTPETVYDGQPLGFPHHKALAVLFYLAVTRRGHSREHLATLLWGESDSASARHSLRSTLYTLRRGLIAGGVVDLLITDTEHVHLNLSAVRCDVPRFHELIAQGSEDAVTQAVKLYRGPFLEGFTLADAPDFDRWQRDTAATVRGALRAAIERLANWARARGASSRAAQCFQRLVELDPLDESAHRQLIGFYLHQGALAKALQQFETLEAALRDELGVSPESATLAMIREALQQRQIVPDVAPVAAPIERLPFRGREDELARLHRVARDVAAGRGSTVLVQGDAGIGKTRFVTELTDDLAHSATWYRLRGTCSPFDNPLALEPFFEAFQVKATEGAIPSHLADLLIQSGDRLGNEPGERSLSVLRAVRLLARGGSVVLLVEDLQWASSASLRLFAFLVARVRDLPVLLIGTVQRAEAIPALLQLLALGRRRGDVHLVTLDTLMPQALADILRALRVSSPSLPALASWLQDRSGGSPYILGELLAQLRSEGILIAKGGEWHVDASRWLHWRATAALPATTHDLVLGRLTDLPAEARHILDVLAIAGEPLPYDLLHALHEGPGDRTLDTLDELRGLHLINERADETFELAHTLLREALLHQLGRLRQRTIHRQLAELIEGCPVLQRQIPVHRMARHAVAGGDVARARRYGLQALTRLKQDLAGPAGVEFLRDLYDLLAPTATAEEQFLVARALGQACRDSGAIDEARRWFAQALTSAKQSGDQAAQMHACFEQAELALVANDYAAAVSAAEAGLVAGESEDQPQRGDVGRGHWLIGAALAMNGIDLVQAKRHLRQALAVYRRVAGPAGQCLALFELGNVAAQHGLLQQALALYVEAGQAAETAGDQYFLALAHNNYAYHSLLLGRADAARQAVAEGRRIAEGAAIPAALLHLCSTEGEIALYAGDWDAADEVFHTGLALAEELGSLERQAGYRAGLALVARGVGDAERATTLLHEALALIESRGYWHLQARLQLWLAETLLASERNEEARRALDAALGVARIHRRELLRLQGERLRAQLLAADGKWPAANAAFARLAAQARQRYPLEAARTESAWGESALSAAERAAQADARERLVAARTHLESCGALADVAHINRVLAEEHAMPASARRAPSTR